MLCNFKVIVCLTLAREPLLDYGLPARSPTLHFEGKLLEVLTWTFQFCMGKALKGLVQTETQRVSID